MAFDGRAGVVLRLLLVGVLYLFVQIIDDLAVTQFSEVHDGNRARTDNIYNTLEELFRPIDEIKEGTLHCINDNIIIALVLSHVTVTAVVAHAQGWTPTQTLLVLASEWTLILALDGVLVLLRAAVIAAIPMRMPHPFCADKDGRDRYFNACAKMYCFDDGFSGHVAFETVTLLAIRRMLLAATAIRTSRTMRVLVTAITAVLIAAGATVIVLTRAHWSTSCILAAAAALLLWRSTGALQPPPAALIRRSSATPGKQPPARAIDYGPGTAAGGPGR
jgi:hypothetical protein